MKTVVITISLIALLIVQSVVFFQGLDLRKLSSWLYGMFSFLCGVALIIAIDGMLVDGLIAGVIFAFLTLFGGTTMRRHKMRYQSMVQPLLSNYGQEDNPSLLARIVNKLLSRYK